jgi:heat shock protein HslJ
MKTIVALPLLALGLAACEPYPQGPGYPGPSPYPQGGEVYPAPSPYPGQSPYPPPDYPPSNSQGEGSYRALGTEPFWNLEIGRDLVFTTADGLRVVQPTPNAINGVAGEIYQTQRINVNIVHSRNCSDGMSDRTYPDQVQVRVDGHEYRGCGAPSSYFASTGENGRPMPAGPSAMDLRNSNWRVVAINGRPTPPANFYLNFMPDRIGAKFGCNSLGAGYTQNGNVLDAGAIMATRMACPDMSFETQGSAVLGQPMTVSGMADRITLSNQAGSIDLVRNN